MNFALLFVFLVLATSADSARILGVFPSSGYSQFILAEKLMREVAGRGHEVTVISRFAPKNPIKNYKTVLVDDKLTDDADFDLYSLQEETIFTNIIILHEFGYILTEQLLANHNVQKLLQDKSQKFDLVFVENFFNEAHRAFATFYNAPLVLFSSMGRAEWNWESMGNLFLPSVNPTSFSGYHNQMTFFQRLHNTFGFAFYELYNKISAMPKHQALVQKMFPKPVDLSDSLYNTSLTLVNSHVSTFETYTKDTGEIEIGGFHIDTKPLPKDIQDFLDQSPKGVVLFSMGSNLRSASLSKEKREAILGALGKLPQKVLWKFEQEDLPNKPDNVMISKWLPQSDILAHPNVVAFITHGGLLSVTETLHHGVPIVGIPIFGDQRMNIARATKKGFGVLLEYKDITEKNLWEALNKVINDPSYRKQAKKFSGILKDRQNKPIETAIYWIEYVLRHNGAPHLRSAALDLHWYQLVCLDVIGFCIAVVFSGFYLLKVVVRMICCRRKKSEKKLKQK